MAGYLVYVPYEYRQENFRASCVYASVSNCMKSVHLWDKAEEFWNLYKGDPNGENPYGLKQKLDRFGVKYKQITNGNEQFLIDALKSGRLVAVSWGGRHMVNLAGKIDGNAYIIDNQSTGKYKIQPWSKFLNSWRRCGGWAVAITEGKVAKPYTRDSLEGLKINYFNNSASCT